MDGAEGVIGEVVAGDAVGACSGAAAEVREFAATACAFEELRVAEFGEELRVAIDIDEAVRADVAGGELEEARGADAAAVVDEDEAFAAVSYLFWVIFGVIIVVGSVVGAGGMYLANQVVTPIKDAVMVANNIALGDFNNEINVTTKDETGQLLNAFETMQTELFGRLEREAVEASRIKDALDSVSTNVMVADETNTILYMNPAVIKLMKDIEPYLTDVLPTYDADNLIGQNIDQFHVNPEHQRNLLKNLTGTYASKVEVSGLNIEIVANPILKDGGGEADKMYAKSHISSSEGYFAGIDSSGMASMQISAMDINGDYSYFLGRQKNFDATLAKDNAQVASILSKFCNDFR